MPQITITSMQTINNDGSLETTANVSTLGGNIKITGTHFSANMVTLISRADVPNYQRINPANISVTVVNPFTNSTEANIRIPALTSAFYTLAISDTDGLTAWKPYSIFAAPPPVWSTAATLPGQINASPFTVTLQATGATQYTVAQGSQLPAGVTLTSGATTATLSGVLSLSTNNNVETYAFNVVATNSSDIKVIRQFSISVSSRTWTTRLSTVGIESVKKVVIGQGITSAVRVIAVGGNGNLTGKAGFIRVSADGVSYSLNAAGIAAAQNNNMWCVAFGGGQPNQVAIGCSFNRIIVSTNLIQWSSRLLLPIADANTKITFIRYFARVKNFGNHLWVIGGSNSSLYYSTALDMNGPSITTWSSPVAPNNMLFTRFQWLASSYVATGNIFTPAGAADPIFFVGGQGEARPLLIRGTFNGTTLVWDDFAPALIAQGWPHYEGIGAIEILGNTLFIGGKIGTYAISTDGTNFTIKTDLRLGATTYSLGEISDAEQDLNGFMTVVGNGKFALTKDFTNWTTVQYRAIGQNSALSRSITSLFLPTGTRYLAADDSTIYSQI